MSRNPARKISAAALPNRPRANITDAERFTSRPRNVSRLGLMPVAARAATILSSSQRLPSPIRRVSIEPETFEPDSPGPASYDTPPDSLKRRACCAARWRRGRSMLPDRSPVPHAMCEIQEIDLFSGANHRYGTDEEEFTQRRVLDSIDAAAIRGLVHPAGAGRRQRGVVVSLSADESRPSGSWRLPELPWRRERTACPDLGPLVSTRRRTRRRNRRKHGRRASAQPAKS